MTADEENEFLKLFERLRVRNEEAILKLDIFFRVLFAQRPEIKAAMLEDLKENPGEEYHITERVRAWLKS